MYIMGMDLSSKCSAFSVFNCDGTDFQLVHYSSVELKDSDYEAVNGLTPYNMAEKLSKIEAHLLSILRSYHIRAFMIEDIFLQKTKYGLSVTSFETLSKIQGFVEYVIYRYYLPEKLLPIIVKERASVVRADMKLKMTPPASLTQIPANLIIDTLLQDAINKLNESNSNQMNKRIAKLKPHVKGYMKRCENIRLEFETAFTEAKKALTAKYTKNVKFATRAIANHKRNLLEHYKKGVVINYVNSRFNLSFVYDDNDTADAILNGLWLIEKYKIYNKEVLIHAK